MSATAPMPDCLTWYRVGCLDEIPPRGARVFNAAGCSIAVFRTSQDDVFALLDECPHRGGPLSQGIVHGNCVTCPLHDWVIDLSTGEARGPDEGATRRFPVRLEGRSVLVGLAAHANVDASSPVSTGETRVAVLR